MDTRWSPTTKYLVAIAFVAAGVGVLYLSRPFFGIIALACILAFLINPVVCFLNRRLRFPRPLATVTTYLLLLLVVALVPLILTPIAIDAVRAINFDAFVSWLQEQTDGLEARLAAIRTVELFDFRFSLAPVIDPVLDTLAGTATEEIPSLERLVNLIPSALGSVTSVAGFLASTISSFALAIALTLVVSIYLSMDAPKFYRGLLEWMPDAYRNELGLLIHKITTVWSAYFRGQITVSLILGLITWLGATVIGLPGAFILGMTAGLLALIPSLGPLLALVPAVIVALVQGSTYLPVSKTTFALIVLCLYILIQQLEGNLITPRIVSQAIDLPPVVVLVGVVIGTSAAGLLGAVLAAPVIATARVLATYAWNKIFDRDPFYHLQPRPPKRTRPLTETVRSTREQFQERLQQLSPPVDGQEQAGKQSVVARLRGLVDPVRWRFEWLYRLRRTPWDTNVTPPEVMAFLEQASPGRALDLGCGTGTNAITLVQHGWQVTGVDFSAQAIRAARRKAARAGLEIDFRAGDVTDLSDLDGSFDLALDIGCLHTLEPDQQQRYAAGLTRLVQPGGRYLLYAWLPRSWGKQQAGLDLQQVADLLAPGFRVDQYVVGEERGFGSAWYWLTRLG